MGISDWSSDVCSSDLLEILHQRLSVPQFVYVSGPAGGGKTTAALMLAWAYFQTANRPFRTDGQDMTTAQILEAAKDHNAAILFNDLAAQQDYMKAGYCLDCRMVSIGITFDAPAIDRQAHRSEVHPSAIQSLIRTTYAVYCLY